MPLAARISHRFGSRTALRGLIALWTMALVLPSFAPNLLALCAALFVYGATAGMADVAMNALGVEVERRLDKSIMSGLHGMWSVGALIGRASARIAATSRCQCPGTSDVVAAVRPSRLMAGRAPSVITC